MAENVAPTTRYRIERAAEGYRVQGQGIMIWEPTLGEAVQRREELECRGWSYPIEEAPKAPIPKAIETIVYGPVTSRRLGRSLGLNLTPIGARVCNFECVYCTDAETLAGRPASSWPSPDDVGAQLGRALAGAGALDAVTISGHGEPTLHPRFPDVTAEILRAVRRRRSRIPVRILTNGSQALLPEIRDALDRLDERIVKLDAEPERTSRPQPPLGALLAGVAALRDVTLQCCFVEGEVSNTHPGAVREWMEIVAELRPRSVQIYTIDRQPRAKDLRPASSAHLEEIACQLRARTGIEAGVFA